MAADGGVAGVIDRLRFEHGLGGAEDLLHLPQLAVAHGHFEGGQLAVGAQHGEAVELCLLGHLRLVELPDERSPELHGAYAHALKSVAVGPDGAIYFSIGSTGNISAQDRNTNPPRATVMRIPPGGGPAQPYATGVRNGTGLAVAPDGSVWTAVNNRDNAPGPGRQRRHRVRQRAPTRVPWPGSSPAANSVGRTAIPTAAPPICRSSATCPPTPTGREWTAPGCPRSNRALARTRRRSDCPSRPASCRGRMPAERWWACTVRGTGSRRAPPRCRSSLGGTAISATQQTLVGGFQGVGRVALGPTGRGGGRARRRGLHHRRHTGAVDPLAPPGR